MIWWASIRPKQGILLHRDLSTKLSWTPHYKRTTAPEKCCKGRERENQTVIKLRFFLSILISAFSSQRTSLCLQRMSYNAVLQVQPSSVASSLQNHGSPEPQLLSPIVLQKLKPLQNKSLKSAEQNAKSPSGNNFMARIMAIWVNLEERKVVELVFTLLSKLILKFWKLLGE